MKVAVIGANGQAGVDIAKMFATAGHNVTGLTHSEIEVTDTASIRDTLQGYDVIINTAALHVVNCEKDPGKAYLVNAIGARNIAETARESHALLIHVSTEQVFDGTKETPYIEFDLPCPRTVYGSTKLAGEYFIINSGADYQILRTAALFGHSPTRGKTGGLNFIELMLKLAREKGIVKVVNDEFVNPTSTVSLAKQMVALSQTEHRGIFHAASHGSCSWYDFAREIFDQTGTEVKLEVAPPALGLTRAKYGVLSGFRLRRLNLDVFDTWENELREYLKGAVE